MARIARVVVPGVPHHVTQRGNRRQPVFFRGGGLSLVPSADRRAGAEIWAYCLMPNHVHLISSRRTTKTACRRRSPRRTGAIPARSMRGSAGQAICCKAAFGGSVTLRSTRWRRA